MAKKKTKIGSAISKISNAAKNAVNKLKAGVSGVNLAASASDALKKKPAMKFTVGEGLTPTQKEKAQTIVVPNRQVSVGGLSTSAKNKGTVSSITFQNNQPINLGKAISSGGLTVAKTGGLVGSDGGTVSLSKAEAPTDAEGTLAASRAPSVNFASAPSNTTQSATTMGIGSTATANATVAGIEQANNQKLEEQKQLQQTMLDSEKEKKSILDKLFKQQEQEPTRQELRQEYEQAFKIQEQTAEINSLNQDLDRVLNEVANQEAVARDRLGTNDFINNQIAQIRRNAEPIINQLSSEIKWRSGLLAEDKALMNEAISDALADSRSRIENNRWFANEYIGMLDKKYQQAYNEYMKQEERDYEERQAFLEYARDVAWEYAQNGIRFNINPYTITPEALAEQIARNPLPQKSTGGGGAYRFSNTQLNTGANRAGMSIDEFTQLDGDVQNFFVSSSNSNIEDIKSLVSAVNNGEVTKSEALDELGSVGINPNVVEYISSLMVGSQVENKKQSFFSRIWSAIRGS